jgi:Zn ribbon nucleic-acid-binding protein
VENKLTATVMCPNHKSKSADKFYITLVGDKLVVECVKCGNKVEWNRPSPFHVYGRVKVSAPPTG